LAVVLLVLFIGLLALVALVYLFASRPRLPISIPWINAGGEQGPDNAALREIEDDVTDTHRGHPPRDLAP
jgi:hypothetical protein